MTHYNPEDHPYHLLGLDSDGKLLSDDYGTTAAGFCCRDASGEMVPDKGNPFIVMKYILNYMAACAGSHSRFSYFEGEDDDEDDDDDESTDLDTLATSLASGAHRRGGDGGGGGNKGTPVVKGTELVRIANNAAENRKWRGSGDKTMSEDTVSDNGSTASSYRTRSPPPPHSKSAQRSKTPPRKSAHAMEDSAES
jgi:hypothetical protein